jgi:membrane protease YdiL (CAAX protease family)
MEDKYKISKKNIYILSIIALCLIAMIIIQFGQLSFFDDILISNMVNDTIFRFLGSIVFIFIIYIFGHKILNIHKPFMKSILIVLPALLISINNFPFIPFLSGNAEITKPVYTIFIFAITCISVGLFEELIFRGLILFFLLEKLPKNKRGLLLSIVISSALFGFMHLFNIFDGANVGATLLQVMYSFAMGLMWSIIVLKTKTIWLAVILHSLYNFSGLLFPTLGNLTEKYDLATIIITSILALSVAFYTYKIFLTLVPKEIEAMY